MVTPLATADSCPQCGADVRLSRARCESCGFLLTAAPPPRTRPPTARPAPRRDDSRRLTALVLVVGGLVVSVLLAIGVWLRDPGERVPQAAIGSAAGPTAPSAAPARLDPGLLLAEARRQATVWHRDAVLLEITAGPLDTRGVTPEGTVELVFSTPSGSRLVGGSETGAERLKLSTSGGPLSKSEERGGKGRVAPEPNCVFENAWLVARHAGADTAPTPSLRYAWSDKYGRPVWEVLAADGQVLRRLDGVSCSILTR